jgi:hypothetical protein
MVSTHVIAMQSVAASGGPRGASHLALSSAVADDKQPGASRLQQEGGVPGAMAPCVDSDDAGRSTDDAYIGGEITIIAAKVAGLASEVCGA